MTTTHPDPPTPRVMFQYSDAELVFGLVGAVGTDLEHFQEKLEANLRAFEYQPNSVRLSGILGQLDPEILDTIGVRLHTEPEYQRLKTYMDAGSKLRAQTRYGGILALHAVAEISRKRTQASTEFLPRTAHVLRSLKHDEEVRVLRRIYGAGFFLVGVFAVQPERQRLLEIRMSPLEAEELIRRDEDEGSELGQKTRDTFALSDVFVRADQAESELGRFLELVFGNTTLTPTRDEHGMFMAYAASVRSGSLARQVGAAIMTQHGEIIATGANDAPMKGGGLYWPGLGDQRDAVRGRDSNDEQKARIVVEVMKALGIGAGPTGAERSDEEIWADGRERLRNTQILDITEYGRDVHAEMDALLACARIGVSPRGCTLYCTTFPCHNCAKHLVAAGIERVVYIEPYPKSRALTLHSDSITVDPHCAGEKVLFEPFVGVGPRRYFDLFSVMGISTGFSVNRKNRTDGTPVKYSRRNGKPKVPLLPQSYFERERSAAQDIVEFTNWLESTARRVRDESPT
ncbi:MAG: cytidine deaminase [Deltaproteobacteria bacterium]|nr:cytidine deaminase [Deltaproteobacteria bacterium]